MLANRPQGVIVVRCLIEGDDSVVQVDDDGPGIPESIGDRIFDPFVTNKPDGMGLGLSLSFDIVTRHGGEITSETADGKGTVFDVRLPLAPTAAKPRNGQQGRCHRGIPTPRA